MASRETELPPAPAELLADSLAADHSLSTESNVDVATTGLDDSVHPSRSESPGTDVENDRWVKIDRNMHASGVSFRSIPNSFVLCGTSVSGTTASRPRTTTVVTSIIDGDPTTQT
jgi:hypothetical protein